MVSITFADKMQQPPPTFLRNPILPPATTTAPHDRDRPPTTAFAHGRVHVARATDTDARCTSRHAPCTSHLTGN